MDNDKEPVTELGVALDSASRCTDGGLNNDSSAGANAGSRAEMMFVTANPLSELVWSPHKGLSLKCADSSLPEKKPSLLWGIGTSNMGLSPPQGITSRGANDDGPLVEGNLSSSQMAPHLNSEVSPRSTIGSIPKCRTMSHEHNLGSSGDMKELTTKMKLSALHANQKADHSEKKGDSFGPTDIQTTDISGARRNIMSSSPEKASMPGPDNGRTADSSSIKMDKAKLHWAQVEPECGDINRGTSSDSFERSRDVGSGNSYTAGMADVLDSEVSTIKQCKVTNLLTPIVTSRDSKHEKLAPVVEEDNKHKMTKPEFTSVPPLEKRESTAENDLQPLKGERTGAEVVGMIIASQPADEGKQSPHQNEGILPKDEVASVEASPSNSRIPHQRKDKEKALSDEQVNGRISKDEDDSHESVESCNSAGLFSAGKRPRNFKQQLIIGGKRMKKHGHESPHSASFHRQDSSFMNWISNMMKGLPKSDPDETPTPSLALTMKPSCHEQGSHDQHFMLHGKTQEPECTAMGFQTIFKALYCPSTRIQDTKTLSLDHQLGEGSKDLELANKTCDYSSIPVAYGEKNDKSRKQIVISYEKFNQGTSQDGEGPSALPNITSANITVIQENHKTSTAENNYSGNTACGLENSLVIPSNSSFWNDSGSPSEGKEDYKLGSIDPKSLNSVTNKSGPLGNLWITRFCPKVSGFMINSPQCNQNVGAAVEGGPLSHSQNCVASVKDQNILEDGGKPYAEDRIDAANKKMQSHVVNPTGSFVSKRTMGRTDREFKSKLNPIQPSQRFKSSEAMASVFARRLDALRHIIPSEVADNAAGATTTCFFCGIKGHDLRDCSEITESELKDFLKNINSYDGAEELSCFCIRCFQLSHWAIACPNASCRKQSHLDGSASLVDLRSLGKMQRIPGNDTHTNNDERNPSVNKDGQCQVALTVSEEKNPRMDTETVGANVNKKMSGMMILNKTVSDLKLAKLLGNDLCEGNSAKNTSKEFILFGKETASSSSAENKSKENQIRPFCNFVNRQIPAVPRGTFEAIKRLRLSRTDILKWMESPMPLFCLNGFFIRLRLRKWEEGQGGTAYYVACINGALGENSSGSSKIPLSVNVGGFRCFVESRFVSNHDFIEDELIAWWCAITRDGGKLPSQEDLNMKLEERKKLGF